MFSRTPTQTQEYEYYQSSSAQNERTNESEMSGERGNSQKGSYEKAQAKNDTPEKVAYFCVPCPHLARFARFYFSINMAFTCAVTITFCGVNSAVGACWAATLAPIMARMAMGWTTLTCSAVSTEA